MDRSDLYDALVDAFTPEEGPSEVIVYPEPPEQLVGTSIVVAPRDPYVTLATYGTLRTHLTVSVLVPRSHGPAMDAIDSLLASVRAVFDGIGECAVGDTRVGIVDEVGGTEYIAASTDLDLG